MIRTNQHQWYVGAFAVTKSQMGNRELAFAYTQRPGALKLIKTEHGFEQGFEKTLAGEAVAGNVLTLANLGEGFPFGGGHAPEAADLITQLERAVQAVILTGLAFEC